MADSAWQQMIHTYFYRVKLFIRNMVCNRCITAVTGAFRIHGLHPGEVHLGEVVLTTEPQPMQLEALRKSLEDLGFGILDDKRQREIEAIKGSLLALVQGGNIEEHFSISGFLSQKLFKDYGSSSRLFSEVEGITIEQFFILQKIEKVKEWLAYNELSLSEIAWKLGYSSVAHLSAQFKKVTGMTPSAFKKLGPRLRKPIDTPR